MNEKIAVVEDDPNTRRLVKLLLDEEGYQTFLFEGAQQALDAMDELHPDLAIVDLMMPEMDGFEFSRAFRANPRFSKTPIIILTAREFTADRYEAFAVGAADYITKPFDGIELKYRVRSFLHLVTAGPAQDQMAYVEVGDVTLEPSRYLVKIADRPITLTKLETAILHLLMSHPGEVFSSAEITRELANLVGKNVESVHAHIRNLRKKVEINPKLPCLVLTLGKKGYYFAQ